MSDDDRVRTGHEEDAALDGGRWNEIAVQLTDVARALHDQDNPQDTLDEIVRSAVALIPGARHAGIMMVLGRQEVRTVAGDDDIVGKVDQAQYETSQGPCLDALYEHKTVSMPDLAAEGRWPAFTERARALGVASMLSFQLFVTERDLGALNLYSAEQHGFDDESEQVGLMFAAHAAVALSNAQQQQQLGRAVHTRDIIGQAKGILMERYKINAEQAFTLLVRTSQHANVRLRELAEKLVQTGELTI
ncbi:GAF and ANTAR domain-containing protein [Actinophytocola algeriensis]|uniref:GAF domain-containing protein n=1 Tax=Actinophytocola algeriensis TaxID=1768010 RepID=A0A7W7QFT7_9PSEU|nr:GAF and ANTAR domain-containing protein [Actinophytocola algeriensis]MBB4912738.1 GAF domain-containing protein [Actinophytocola algeriensis]MBE1473594.1 GAF domain-containing protein [Actinophytocola algeriensis]